MKRIITWVLIGVAAGSVAAQPPVFRRPKAIQRKGYVPRQLYPSLDVARDVMQVNALHDGVWMSKDLIPFTGKGVIVGIIDGGIDSRHLAFRDGNDLNRSRAQLVIKTESASECESDTLVYKYHYAPDGEVSPREFIDGGCNGHGTHTAGCAAGGYRGNDYYGIAPDATLVLTTMGNTLYDDEVYFGLSATLDYARMVGMPCVASLSLGSVVGPHNGKGTLNEVLEEKLSPEGQIVCFAAGNDGRMACHLDRNFAEDPGELGTGFYSPNGFTMAPETTFSHIYSETNDYEVAFALLTYGESCEELCRTEWVKASDIELYGSIEMSYDWDEAKEYMDEYSYIYVSALPESLERRGLSIQTGTPVLRNQMSDVTIALLVRSNTANVEILTEPSLAQFYKFANPDYVTGNSLDCISDLATADKVVAVGAYNHRDRYPTINGGTSFLYEYYGDYQSMASYSSYTDRKGVLPQVAAPGTLVISSILSTSSYDQVAKVEYGGKRHFWGACSGTSMACPVMAGTVALWLQAKPDMTYDELMDVFEHCSTEVTPSYKARYGMPSAYDGLKYILEKASVNDITSEVTPRELMMRNMGNGRWECVVPFATAGGEFAIYSTSGMNCGSGSFEGCTFDLTLPSSAGMYVIDVQTPQGRVTRKIQR